MAGFGQLAGLPEIVRDSQLPATFRWEGQQQFTIHTQGASRRAKQSQEVWAHMGTLGQGGFGSVELQAKQSKRAGQTKELRAVKSIRIPEDELNENREFYVRELEAIVKFSQARYGELFVKSYGWFTSQGVLHIAMEYCELGDLQRYLFKKCQDRRLPENQAHDIASQVLDALTRMHEEKFAHRDLKPANILIKSHPPSHPWVVKVADFGISRRDQGTTMNPTTSVRGTGSFMPPELLGFSGENSRAVDLYAVDMWCYGETLFRMLTGGGTFEKPADLYGYYFGHVKFPRAVLEEIQLSPAVIDFLQSLLTCDPTQRLTSETALDHAWMETDFHGSDTSSRRASRRLSSTKPVDGIDPSMLENTIVQMASTENTDASASWTENFSQMHLDDYQQTTPLQQQTVSHSQNHPATYSSKGLAGTKHAPATNAENSPGLPTLNMSSGDSRTLNQGDLLEDTAASLSWTSAFPTSQTFEGKRPIVGTDTPQIQPTQTTFTPLPAPTETDTTTPTELTSTEFPNPGDEKPSYSIPDPPYSIPDEETPVTIRTRGHKASKSQTEMFREYIAKYSEGGRSSVGGSTSTERKPSVRVQLTPSRKGRGDGRSLQISSAPEDQSEATLVPNRNSQAKSEANDVGEFDEDLYPWTQRSTPTSQREDSGLAGIPQSPPNPDGFLQGKQAETVAKRHDVIDVQRYTHDEMIAILNAQADAFREARDFMSARNYYTSCWESAKSTLGEEHSVSIVALRFLIKAEFNLNEYNTAENLCRRMVTLQLGTQGPDQAFTLSSKIDLAYCLGKLYRFDEAISLVQDVISSCRRNQNHSSLCEALSQLIQINLDKGDPLEGEMAFHEYIKTKGNVLGHTHELIIDDVYKFAITVSRIYSYHEEASRAAQRFFELTDALSRSGEPLSKKTRSQQEEMKLLLANPRVQYNTGSESSIDMRRPPTEPQVGSYQGFSGSEATIGQRGQQRGQLHKNAKKFTDAYDQGDFRGPEASTGAAKRVMDFFRKRGKARGGEER